MWAESSEGLYRHPELTGLSVPHGVTSRLLGDMKEPAARGAALEAAGAKVQRLRTVQQVHGRRVVRWEDVPPRGGVPEADALVSDRPAATMGVYIADCQPLFLWEKTGLVVAIGHLGWRGTAERLGQAMVRELVLDYGLDPRDLRAAVGPHIGPCCYEVGPEVVERFPAEAVKPGRKLALAEATRLQLAEAGLPPEQVDVEAPCTRCTDRFYSYRREKGAGRMLAFVARP